MLFKYCTGGESGSRTKALNQASRGNSENRPNQAGNSDGSAATNSDDDLDQSILGMEKAVGTAFYRNILREYGRVNQPMLTMQPSNGKCCRCWGRLLVGLIVWKLS